MLVVLGRVGRPHGVRGEIRVAPFHPQSSLLLERATVDIAGKTFRVLSARAASDVLILTLEGVGSREAADVLKGAEVSVPRDELPALAKDELYVGDLVGCECWEGETALGRVVSVQTYPASTCLVIESAEGKREIPAVAPYFAAFDESARRIEIAHSADFPLEARRAKKES